MLKKLFGRIIHILSIDISSKYVQSALDESKNVIILHRHKIFLVKIFFFQSLSCILFFSYVSIVFTHTDASRHYLLIWFSTILFLLWIYTSSKLYHKHFSIQKTIYTHKEASSLLDRSNIELYIAKTIAFSTILGIDIILSIIIQTTTDLYMYENPWYYVAEISIFIIIIIINIKVLKLFLDFEMDQVISLPWKVKYIDREWLYNIKSKIYLQNQIQSIEIVRNWRLDSLFGMWTLYINTAETNRKEWYKTLKFGKISYYDVLEDKLNNVIYNKDIAPTWSKNST